MRTLHKDTPGYVYHRVVRAILIDALLVVSLDGPIEPASGSVGSNAISNVNLMIFATNSSISGPSDIEG